MSLGILLLIVFIVLVLIRVNFAFSIGIVSLLYLFLSGSRMSPMELILNAYQILDRFPMLAVPLFILAGALMATGGVAKQILNVAEELVGGMKGGYALITIPACLIFGGLSGSAPATSAAIGAIMIPAMIERGYSKEFAAGIIACAGVIAIIIPPSNPMIIYALANNSSIGKLFLGGFLPGIVLAVGIALPAYLICRKQGWGGIKRKRTIRTFLKAVWTAKWALFTPVIILGGIYSGIFTPTESAAVACFYSFIIGLFVYREFTLKDTPNILRTAAMPTVTIFTIIAFAAGLGTIMSIEQLPQRIAAWLLTISDNRIIMFFMINFFLLFIGTFMDMAASIIILSPILFPIVQSFGMNEIHFGIMLIINLGIGFVTPPFGANLFLMNTMTGLKIHYIFRGAAPMVLGMILALIIITYIPEITMFIPDLIYD